MTPIAAAGLLAVPALLAIATGSSLLRKAFSRSKVLPEELALAGAWVFVVGGLVWLGAALSGAVLLGFDVPWTWLAAAHFLFAGFGALTVTALCCRAVSKACSLRILRVLLIAHPVAYLIIAAGISGYPFCDEIGATCYEVIFLTQFGAFALGQPDRISRGPRRVIGFALAVPIVTLIPALAWAWGQPMFDISGMVRYHGLVNAVGHVGLALVAFAVGRPPSHSPLRDGIQRRH